MLKKIIGQPTGYMLLALCISLWGCSGNPNENVPEAQDPMIFVTTLDKEKLLEKQIVKPGGPISGAPTITIDTSTTYQTMDGFGFTLNGGSAMLLQKMSAPARAGLLKELFGKDSTSIGINYLRLSVGASDLDEMTWSYNDLPAGETDVALQRFSLGYDTLYLIPTLKEILKIAPDIPFMGSPWSPPAWMKDNNDTRGGSLKPEYYGVYAAYLTRYVQEMQKQGIVIDALTVQNEPLHPGNNPSLLMLEGQQAEFIRDHLGPAFRQNGIKTKILIYDHNADRPDYPITILNDPEAAQFIDGSAFHLYGGSIDTLSEVREAHPEKNIYFTEQWIGAPGNFAGDFTWHIENLIIGAPRNWARTVLQWNLAADENQGPHTDRGGCVGCLGAITLTGDNATRNPAYYIVAQASKFVPSGSVRIASNVTGNVPNVAFRAPDGKIVLILQNRNETDKNIEVKIGDKRIPVSLEAGAVGTLVVAL